MNQQDDFVVVGKERREPEMTAVSQSASPVSIVSMVLGIVAFFFNPFYASCLAAIVTGIVGLSTSQGRPKGFAIAGLVLGGVALVMQFIVDLVLSFFTFGLSFLI